jgi:RNA polymerase sigma-70 factor (ECF subfamily)
MPELRRWVARRVDQRDDIDDVLQDIWLRLCARREGGGIDNVRAYLYQIASSVLTDRARRGKVRGLGRTDELTEAHHPIEEITPDRVLSGRREADRLIERIAALPERTRDIFLLNRFEGQSYRQIADGMSISVSAVEKHIMKALRALTEDRNA